MPLLLPVMLAILSLLCLTFQVSAQNAHKDTIKKANKQIFFLFFVFFHSLNEKMLPKTIFWWLRRWWVSLLVAGYAGVLPAVVVSAIGFRLSTLKFSGRVAVIKIRKLRFLQRLTAVRQVLSGRGKLGSYGSVDGVEMGAWEYRCLRRQSLQTD